MSSSDDRFVKSSGERDVDALPKTLPPGSALSKGSVNPETFITESVIQESFKQYDDIHFPDSPIEESGTINPETLGTRLFSDEEVTPHIIQRIFLQQSKLL